MTDPHGSPEIHHVPGMEDIADQPAPLSKMEAITLAGDDTGSILPPVLEDRQGLIEFLIDFLSRNDTGNATHRFVLLQSVGEGFFPQARHKAGGDLSFHPNGKRLKNRDQLCSLPGGFFGKWR